ncbi:hypothetical protein NIASO_00705 [Niabella soli DSM 19437]|uniref:Uncharacterized protein n=1 Tax=Niabella soli DSM 19437 TaxID=929713 RepID=W0F1V7_9BACT|nr:hypothetical protein NIASO_00705 [Niabella soli DSM 19437]
MPKQGLINIVPEKEGFANKRVACFTDNPFNFTFKLICINSL